MTKNSIGIDEVQQLMDMLQGELPDDINLQHLPPPMTKEQAFSIIWFLQEITRVLPDSIEMCHVCDTLFDYNDSGHIVDEYDEWYEKSGIPPALVEANQGMHFCDSACELSFFRGLMRDDLPTP